MFMCNFFELSEVNKNRHFSYDRDAKYCQKWTKVKFTYRVTDQKLNHFLPFLAIFYIPVSNNALQKMPKMGILNCLTLVVPSLKSSSLPQSAVSCLPLRNVAGKIEGEGEGEGVRKENETYR